MSMGLQDAYSLSAVQEMLRARIAEQVRQRQQEFQNEITRRGADRADAQLTETSAWRRAQEAETKRQHDLTDEDRTFKEDMSVAELTPPGDVPVGSPIAGRLKRVGLLDESKQRPAVDVGPLLPGDTGAERMGVKRPTMKQLDTIADNERQAAAAAAKNKPQGQSEYGQERNRRTVQSVDELIGRVSRWNTGAGSLLASLPETDARNFAAELNTLKANIAFGELTAMREASKTGGALGQVSERELMLLESTLGALDVKQSPANLKAQLQKVKDSIERWNAAQGGGDPSIRPVPSHDPSSTSPGAAAGGAHPPIVKNGWNYEWQGDRYTAVSPASNAPPRPSPASPGAARPAGASPTAPTPLDTMQWPTSATLPNQRPSGVVPSRSHEFSPEGAAALKRREGGFVAQPYDDVNGLAIGYGMHTVAGQPVTRDTVINQDQADAEMDAQVKAKYGPIVDRALQVRVTQQQYDALVSMAWNLPRAAEAIISRLNAGLPVSEAEFTRWSHSQGKPNPGLERRRREEFSQFGGGTP